MGLRNLPTLFPNIKLFFLAYPVHPAPYRACGRTSQLDTINRFVANQAHMGSLRADDKAGAKARTAVLQVKRFLWDIEVDMSVSVLISTPRLRRPKAKLARAVMGN